MLNIEELKKQIVELLKPMKPDKIILFGSYANGTYSSNSDIDIFLLKDDLKVDDIRDYKLELQKKLFILQKKYLLGIDLFVDSSSRMEHRIKNFKDQFYIDILNKGVKIYG